MLTRNVSRVPGLLAVLALILGLVAVQPALAQDDPLAHCDATVRALVWAARDAYGYDVTPLLPASTPPGADDAADDEVSDAAPAATPEADDEAWLPIMKVAAPAQQTGAGQAAVRVNCEAVRANVVAFIFNANSISLDTGEPVFQFTVDGRAYTPNFHVLMSGPQEVPGPGDDDGQGEAWLYIDGTTNTVCWHMVTAGIALPAAGAHIHVGAQGESGGVVVALSAPGADGAATGCTEADAEVVEAILENPSGYYVNVHTGEFPDGAVRGQLLGM